MTQKVFYLCHHSTLEEGLVFPSELDEGECAFPGLFVIEENQGKLTEKYAFDAIHDHKRLRLTLFKRRDNTFVVKTELGWFYFMAHPIKAFYAGKNRELQNHNSFWFLEPLLRNKLEESCQNNHFYFVGSVG